MNKIKVKRFLFAGAEEVNVFIASCEKSKSSVVIDAGGFRDEIADYISKNELRLDTLFITHNHYDHVDSLKDILQINDKIIVIAGLSSVSDIVHVPEQGEMFKLGELSGSIHYIPGHTPDMIVLHLHDRLFTGDALFAGAVGGTASAENYRLQISNIQKSLLNYPDETIVHPGHGPDTTLGIEKLFNPFLTA